jgi:hypothetical protein
MIVRFTRSLGVLLLAAVLPAISRAETPTGHFDTPPAQNPSYGI